MLVREREQAREKFSIEKSYHFHHNLEYLPDLPTSVKKNPIDHTI